MKQVNKFKMPFYVLSFIFLAPVGLHGLLNKEKKGKISQDIMIALFGCKSLFDVSMYFEYIQNNFFITIGYTIFWFVIMNQMYRRSYKVQV